MLRANIKDWVKQICSENLLKTLLKNFTEKGLRHMRFIWNAVRLLLLKYLLKIKTAVPDQSTEAVVRRYFSKPVFWKMSH